MPVNEHEKVDFAYAKSILSVHMVHVYDTFNSHGYF